MNFVIIIVVALLAGFLAIALYSVAVGSGHDGKISDSRGLLQPLDVAGFNNLMDPDEERFLQDNLPASDYRKIQRLRLRAAIDYVRCAASNSAGLIAAGRIASDDADAELSRQAREMVTAAVHLRVLSLLVLCLLCVKVAFPGLRLSLAGFSASHKRLLLQLGALSRIKGSREIGSHART